VKYENKCLKLYSDSFNKLAGTLAQHIQVSFCSQLNNELATDDYNMQAGLNTRQERAQRHTHTR